MQGFRKVWLKKRHLIKNHENQSFTRETLRARRPRIRQSPVCCRSMTAVYNRIAPSISLQP